MVCLLCPELGSFRRKVLSGLLYPAASPTKKRTEGNLSERKPEERGLIDKAVGNLWVKRS